MNWRSRRLSIALVLVVFFAAPWAHAWGQRGHAITCESAAALLADSKRVGFLKERSFELAYYCNVPDLVWKRPNFYKSEWFNHFMDLEIFERELKLKESKTPVLLHSSRAGFDAAHKTIPESADRAFWRIDELMKKAGTLASDLRKTDLARDERHRLQADWLVTIGALAHYAGDLSQPLHTSENYDGQLSEQKGIHAWFEDDLVNHLYFDGDHVLGAEVRKSAQAKWKKVAADWQKLPVRELLLEATTESNQKMTELLKIDKKTGRKDLSQAARAYRAMIIERLAAGTVLIAALWSRELDWSFDGEKFYTFVAEPEFITPDKSTSATPPAKKD